VLTPDGKLPSVVTPGTILLIVDGVKIDATFKVISNSQLAVTYGSISFTLSIIGPDGLPRTVSERQPLTGQLGDEIYLEGSGYLPGSKVTVWIFSTPIKLGDLFVDKAGKFAGTVLVSQSVPIGEHTIQINGLDASKKSVSFSTAAIISEKKSTSIDEAIKDELGTEVGPGFTTPAFGKTVTKGVLFTKNSATLINYEKRVILTYRKIVAKNSVVSCVGFTYSKKPSKNEIAIAKKQATAACRYLLPAKNAKFKVITRDIKLAKNTGRRTSATKKYPVNILITTPKKA
jgi:hypothetical protein